MSSALSTERLARWRARLAAHVERGAVPGVVALLTRRDDTHVEVIGAQQVGGAPMRRDTIFRITSMTKPVTAVAAMILVEQGKLQLDDAVDRSLPELANRRVLRRIDAQIFETVPAKRAITLRDLLTFRSGHGMIPVFPDRYPIQRAMAEAGFTPGPIFPSFPPDELMRRYGTLPLIFQPGERWLYNAGSEILGVLIGRVAGVTFGEFLRDRIFAPLHMTDTAFFVPAEKHRRFATVYGRHSATKQLTVFDSPDSGRFSSPPVFENGAAGLVSTADDFNAFAQMMLNGGALGNERILSRASVELMTRNHISADEKRESQLFLGATRGWGFGMSVFRGMNERDDAQGRFGWDGGYGTSWYSDPREQLTGILLTQRLMDSPQPPRTITDFWNSVSQLVAD